ncbi:MAG: molecular chaperone HtpG [Chloroflexota bacterium]|nr:molecular chaperone HtpG [Chloroflexota bacterium]MDE2947999.1 molecular chaperone HtpG [Chloroflexota bacterium]
MSEQHSFQAETQQLLNILIHSLYTEKEIFLRELISNASDALNRLQFEMLTNDDVQDPQADLEIHIEFDEEAKTLTVSDTGIGMNRAEIMAGLGTIAKSGAKAFIEAMRERPESAAAIIGQFGVGFYSAFMVAKQVDVISRSFRPEDEAVKWSATGGTNYTLETAEKDLRGTEVVVHLKDDEEEFTRGFRIKDIIRRHSDYVAFPIFVGDDEEPANKQQAIWRRAPSEVEDEEYDSFYRMLTMDFAGASHHIHMRADVPMQFYALLFIPGSGQQNMFSPRSEPGLKLYARKVLIEEYNRDLLPEYLSFVQGVVDSEDLPLSVTRESIQATRVMASLKRTITRRVLSELKRMAKNDRDKYLTLFQEFGAYLKQGLVIDTEDRSDLEPLMFFQTTHDDDPSAFHTLDDYVERMSENQDDIYYVVADDYASGSRSPHLDAFRQRGIEVLYFTHPVDAMLPMGLADFKGRKLVSVDSAELDLEDVGAAPEQEESAQAGLGLDSLAALTERVKAILGARVSDVRDSKTLVGSPARLVSEDDSSNRYMYRINRLLDKDYELPVKALELNPRHPLMHNLSGMIAGGGDAGLIDTVVEQVFETALLQDGIHPDPSSMAERLTLLMQAATGSASADLDFADVKTVISEPAPAETPQIDLGDLDVEDGEERPTPP